MSFAFFKMPYRVDHCTGQFKLVDSHLDFAIHSTIHHHPASLTGYADNIGIGSPTFRANLDVPGHVPIDEKLLVACDAQPILSKIARGFNPSGFVSGQSVIERNVPEGPIDKWFDIRIHECEVRHNNFAYPIDNVNGQVLVNNSHYQFQNLSGTNNNCLLYTSPSPRD